MPESVGERHRPLYFASLMEKCKFMIGSVMVRLLTRPPTSMQKIAFIQTGGPAEKQLGQEVWLGRAATRKARVCRGVKVPRILCQALAFAQLSRIK